MWEAKKERWCYPYMVIHKNIKVMGTLVPVSTAKVIFLRKKTGHFFLTYRK
jgi:propanediol dehydratase large subunit